MKKYAFSLETVLRARRAQEEVARQSLADANHRLRRSQALQAAARDAYHLVAARPFRGPGERDHFLDDRSRELRLAEAVEQASAVVIECERKAAECNAAWVLAGQRVASLERLDERRRSEWDQASAREESTVLDDIAGARWSLKAGSGAPPQ